MNDSNKLFASSSRPLIAEYLASCRTGLTAIIEIRIIERNRERARVYIPSSLKHASPLSLSLSLSLSGICDLMEYTLAMHTLETDYTRVPARNVGSARCNVQARASSYPFARLFVRSFVRSLTHVHSLVRRLRMFVRRWIDTVYGVCTRRRVGARVSTRVARQPRRRLRSRVRLVRSSEFRPSPLCSRQQINLVL